MKKKIVIIAIIILVVLSSFGCGYMEYQTAYLDKLDALGFSDNYAVMPSGELNMKLKEKGYTLLDEYKSTKLYINPNVKDKYIMTRFWASKYEGYEKVGWRIFAIDEQIPKDWEGKKEY